MVSMYWRWFFVNYVGFVWVVKFGVGECGYVGDDIFGELFGSYGWCIFFVEWSV